MSVRITYALVASLFLIISTHCIAQSTDNEPPIENGMDLLRYRYQKQKEQIERYEKTLAEQAAYIYQLKKEIEDKKDAGAEIKTYEEEYKKAKTLSAPLLSVADRLEKSGDWSEAFELYQIINNYFPYSFEAHIARTKMAEKNKVQKKK